MTDTLLALAELAVAITGFASIVLVFHSMTALVFCLLPVVLEAFGLPAERFVFVLGLELPIAGLLIAFAFGALSRAGAGLFIAAFCAQILQAAILFFRAALVRRDQMED